jgi:uncharacterized membrane protein
MGEPVAPVLGLARSAHDPLDERHAFAEPPTAAYGIVLALLTISYLVFEKAIIACNGPNSKLASAIGGELKGKLTLAAYLVAADLAFISAWLAIALYFAIALSWFVPDRRIETIM